MMAVLDFNMLKMSSFGNLLTNARTVFVLHVSLSSALAGAESCPSLLDGGGGNRVVKGERCHINSTTGVLFYRFG